MTESPTPTLAVAPVTFEHTGEALGIGLPRPRLSWVSDTGTPDWRQHAYELQLIAADGTPGESVVQRSDASVLVPWPFADLVSRQRVGVRVRVAGADAHQAWSPWSDTAWAEAGLLEEADWSARFVTPDWTEDTSRDNPCPVLKRRFDVDGPVRSARLYATALGLYEAELNGVRVGDTVLAPGWTPYGQRLRYQTYDVTDLLRTGPNELTVTLADGWYRGRLGFEGKRALYGERLALLAQLEITHEDGTVVVVVTGEDGSWQAAHGPVRRASLYDGETYDARVSPDSWRGVRAEAYDLARLSAPVGPPVRPTEELAPVVVTTSPSGKTIVDFGQNLVGWLGVTVDGEAGQELVLRHAEVLQDGELATEPLRTAEATDRYILRGGGAETWEPRFTFHGFRYAEITGWPGDFDPAHVRAVVVHSDMARTGRFTCSDDLVNRLHENAVWSMRGNFVDVPTDCPQRDERLGWTGDIQAFAPTACQLYDSAGFLASWLADLAVEQGADGTVPFIVPKAAASGSDLPTAAWGDAATIVPWTLYLRYGDAGVLDAQFDSMRAWVDKVAELAGPDLLWNSGFQFGDWLDPTAPPEQPQAGKTPPDVVATAYFARSAQIVADAAEILGREKEAAHYADLAARVRAAFQAEYTTANGRVIPDAQTAYALALQFGLLPREEQRVRAADRLAALLRENGYRIGTGFVGTPLMCDALADHGHLDAAYRLLLQQECPSWLYTVVQGGTTIWERWDSLRPDGTLNSSGMTSFNHYALGAVVDWLYRTVAGLDAAEPGYRRLRIAPRPGGGLTHASAELRTPYGPASVAWRRDGDSVTVEADVPPNTTADVQLPDGQPMVTVGSGQHTWTVALPEYAARAPLTVDTPMSEMLDHPQAMEILRETLTRHWPEAAAHMDTESTGGAGYAEVSPRQLAGFFAEGDAWLAELEQRLAEI
ncbi:alpha-L-rhamnosidase [Yinghuangia seranimata]|uniref:alpha-L-rhamnosidase n=1 Tax=Yinghuangia seranimata TaxID=408067 RepID=UPI00248B5E81|nr:alpha-L-rhamnosidase [Yinghuangia seranimata]MDI2129418.1 family 78 glycoside hydrolase catalytic domain [Yinghuangia seranimata]